MALTDFIVFVLLSYSIYSGWRKGIFKTTLAPLSMIFCVCLSFLYFQKDQNIRMTLLMLFVSPILMNLLLLGLYNLWQEASNKNVPLPKINRGIGSFISFICCGILIMISVFLIAIVPSDALGIQGPRRNVIRSASFSIFKNRFPIRIPKELTLKLFREKMIMEDILKSREYEDLVFDERFHKLIDDYETVQQMQEYDFKSMSQNKKMFKMLMDRDLLAKCLRLYVRVVESIALDSKGSPL